MIGDTVHIEHLILSYLKDELSTEQRAILDKWVSASEENKELFDNLTHKNYLMDKLSVYHDIERSKNELLKKLMLGN